MDDTQKMEYARAFLQKEVESEFPYPFQILTEEDSFLFCFKNGRRDCCARLKATEGMLDKLCSGDKKTQKQEKERVLRVLEAAVEAQENTALSEKSEYGKMKNMLILRPLNLDFYRSELVNVPYIRIGDVALVLYCVLSHLGGVPGSGSEMDGPRSGGNAGGAGQYELFVSAAAVFDPVPDGLGRKAVRERHFYGGGRRTENPAGHAQLSVDKYAGNQRSDCRFLSGCCGENCAGSGR